MDILLIGISTIYLTSSMLYNYVVLMWTCTALVTGQRLSVKPSRIIAGQEPEKTNEFLQAIARAVQKKVVSFM